MKYLLLIPLLLVGCGEYRESDYPVKKPEFANLPDTMKDCEFNRIWVREVGYVFITRCPNSTVTTRYPYGKQAATSIVVDGVKYVKEEKK